MSVSFSSELLLNANFVENRHNQRLFVRIPLVLTGLRGQQHKIPSEDRFRKCLAHPAQKISVPLFIADQDIQPVFMSVVSRSPEDPIFTNQPYPVRALTPVWIRPGTSILQLQALDANAGMEIRYQLESGKHLTHKIKQETPLSVFKMDGNTASLARKGMTVDAPNSFLSVSGPNMKHVFVEVCKASKWVEYQRCQN